VNLERHVREAEENAGIQADGDLLLSLLGGCELRQQGSQYWARCPLHAERTGSLNVRQKNGRWSWRCFGCNVGGDAVDLLMRLDRIDFREARARLLGRRAGGGYAPAGGKTRDRGPGRAQEPAPTHVLTCEYVRRVDDKRRRGWAPCHGYRDVTLLELAMMVDVHRTVRRAGDDFRWLCPPCSRLLSRERRRLPCT
jgi:hypothetical protein